jgi:hypothetical protein
MVDVTSTRTIADANPAVVRRRAAGLAFRSGTVPPEGTAARLLPRRERCFGVGNDRSGQKAAVGRVSTVVRPVAIAGVVAFGLLQLVPYGWRHPNPPSTGAPPWPSAEVQALARAACYDCHSNETEWPWYSYVAPMSWLVRYDVERGREASNFSTWDDESDASDGAEAVEDGSMPPDRYVRLHPGARLSAEERQALIAALEALEDEDGDGGGNSGPGGGDDGGGGGGGGDGGGDNSGPGGGGDGSGGNRGPGGGGDGR